MTMNQEIKNTVNLLWCFAAITNLDGQNFINDRFD